MGDYDTPGTRAMDASVLQVKAAVDQLRLAQPGATVSEAVAAGQVKTYGTGLIVAAASGNVRITLENPTGSNHKLTLIGVSVASSVTGFGSLLIGPTTGLPATAAIVPMNAIVGGGLAGVAVVKADNDLTTPLGGGTVTGIRVSVGANVPRELALPAPLVLLPGVKIGVAVNLGAAFSFASNLTFIEAPL